MLTRCMQPAGHDLVIAALSVTVILAKSRGATLIRFFVTRIIGLVFVLVSVSFVTFIMGYFAPGDPIIALLGNHTTPQIYHSLKHIYGLDLPWYQQYFNFINHLLHDDATEYHANGTSRRGGK